MPRKATAKEVTLEPYFRQGDRIVYGSHHGHVVDAIGMQVIVQPDQIVVGAMETEFE